jgi:hypothetical protein
MPEKMTSKRGATSAKPVKRASPAAAKKPPKRAIRASAPVAAGEAQVNRYLAAYVMGLANRLANGASNYYRSQFNLGMSEWRIMMAIGRKSGLIVREVAEHADIDYAAASKSLRVLQERGLVEIEQTNSRGRAAIAGLTPAGQLIYRKLRESARRRQQRLVSSFKPAEVEQLWALLQRLEAQIPHMNAD